MKNISDIIVTKELYYKTDIIPFRYLSTNSAVSYIKDSFNFVELKSLPDSPSSINFTTGEFKLKNKLLIIHSLLIEPRRIMLIISGESKDADLLYKKISTIIDKFDYNKLIKKSEPLLKIEQTSCNVELDFDLNKLFNNKFINYLNDNLINKASNEVVNAYNRELTIRSEIIYNKEDPNLKSNNISPLPTFFTIANRIDTNLEDRRYYTVSPTNSDTHFKLLSELEKLFK